MFFKKFSVTAPGGAALPVGGLVALTTDQENRRRHALESVKGDKKPPSGHKVFKAIQPIFFKCGEVIYADPGAIAKSLFADISPAPAKSKSPTAAKPRKKVTAAPPPEPLPPNPAIRGAP